MDWLRLHHEVVTDPKWATIARRCGQPRHAIIAVWTAMLVCASQADKRGELEGWDHEDIGVALDLDTAAVEAIHAGMQGKVLDGNRIINWKKRQPKREDGSADRARAWRERQKQEPNGPEPERTQPNATERNRTLDKRRGEEIRSSDPNGSAAVAASVDPIKVLFDAAVSLLARERSQKEARSLVGMWRSKIGDEQLFGIIFRALNKGPTEAVPYLCKAVADAERGKRSRDENLRIVAPV